MVKTYLAWSFLHYGAAHAYTRLCTPPTLQGLFLSPFLATSPHCSAVRWIMSSGAETLTSMWLILGSWIAARLAFETAAHTTSKIDKKND